MAHKINAHNQELIAILKKEIAYVEDGMKGKGIPMVKGVMRIKAIESEIKELESD